MIAVTNYIQKLLYDHEFVVIPNFGGFISRSKHAYYDKSSDFYLPMTKQVAFNESLKLDDGLLTQYIALNEQISTDDAQSRIKCFVDSIRKGLVSGSHHLESIGSFSLNDDQKLVFEPSAANNFWKESYGFKSLAVATSEVKAVQQGLAIVETNRLPTRHSKPNPSKIAFGIATSCLVVTCLLGSFLYSPLERNAFFSSLNPFTTLRSVTTTFTHRDNKSTDSDVISVSLPHKNEIEPLSVEKSSSKDVVENLVVEKAIPKVVLKEVATKPSKPITYRQNSDIISDENGRYHVIVGAFTKPENAEKCLITMQKLGFKNAQVLIPTIEGELVKVSIATNSTQERAFRSAKRASVLVKTSAWVFSN